MTQTFTSRDEGKQVVTTDGDVVGSVIRIEAGDAHVQPKPGLLEGCGSWITGAWDECDAFRLDRERVDSITDDRIIIAATEPDSSRSETAVKK